MKNYKIIGIISEYDPFHNGHALQIQRTRQMFGPNCVLICIMSGNYTQRGDFAMFSKQARARCALTLVDLVFEMPLCGSLSSSQDFALEGIRMLNCLGADIVSFGSECGSIEPLKTVAEAMVSEEFSSLLLRNMKSGASYAACAQAALDTMLGRDAEVLKTPNNLLGVEYIKAIKHTNSAIVPFTIKRTADDPRCISSSAIRKMLLEGKPVDRYVPDVTAHMIREEVASNRAPVVQGNCAKALMHALRSMSAEQFSQLNRCGEGLDKKLVTACARAGSPDEVVALLKSKRYTQSRLRRLVMCALLGLDRQLCEQESAYIRLLGANQLGRDFLRSHKEDISLPILTRPASVRKLSRQAQAQFATVSRSTDLYELARPGQTVYPGGSEWKQGPIMID